MCIQFPFRLFSGRKRLAKNQTHLIMLMIPLESVRRRLAKNQANLMRFAKPILELSEKTLEV